MMPYDLGVLPDSKAEHTDPSARKVRRRLSVALSLVSFVFVGVWLWGAVGRIAFPYEIEWIENGTLAEAERILSHGQPIRSAFA